MFWSALHKKYALSRSACCLLLNAPQEASLYKLPQGWLNAARWNKLWFVLMCVQNNWKKPPHIRDLLLSFPPTVVPNSYRKPRYVPKQDFFVPLQPYEKQKETKTDFLFFKHPFHQAVEKMIWKYGRKRFTQLTVLAFLRVYLLSVKVERFCSSSSSPLAFLTLTA